MNANQIIDALGGTSKVAELCHVTTGAVSQWRDNGIPEARLMYLKVIRPDVFGDDTVQAEGEGSETVPPAEPAAGCCAETIYPGPDRRVGQEPGQLMRRQRSSNGDVAKKGA